jgi:hypothetical protein
MTRPDDQQVTLAGCSLNQGWTDLAAEDFRTHVDVGGIAPKCFVEGIGKPLAGVLSPDMQQRRARRTAVGNLSTDGRPHEHRHQERVAITSLFAGYPQRRKAGQGSVHTHDNMRRFRSTNVRHRPLLGRHAQPNKQ